MIKALIEDKEFARNIIKTALGEIHSLGPKRAETFEQLAYVKEFHPDLLAEYESRLIATMGLFFKSEKPSTLLEEVYSIFSEAIKEKTGHRFTPTQADAFEQINGNRYFSFSAPTSAGKSFLFRELISSATKDIVIVLPSRALIAEYFDVVTHLVDKSVLVLQFIEDVNRAHVKRRIFIVTPERGGELFKFKDRFDIEMFLLDEAQISEELVRGLTFDSFVRRADRAFPLAKKIFAHPFIRNPEAQLLKHNFAASAHAATYDSNSVGKIFASFENGTFTYFSPYTKKSDAAGASMDFVERSLKTGGTLLVYTAKTKIYDRDYIAEFEKYIALCPKVVDAAALAIISELRRYIGAKDDDAEKHSVFIEMMLRGIVVHHGSMPLKARLLIENFIRSGNARICFATATLNQGINMPFDIVWIDSFFKMTTLNLKNLIGRSGRSTQAKGAFDYGYTIVKKKNVLTFKKRIGLSPELDETSGLDRELAVDADLADIVEAVKLDSFDLDLNLPKSQIERISAADLDPSVRTVLDNLTPEGVPITGAAYYAIPRAKRQSIKDAFKKIYAFHLRRAELSIGEACVLSAAIPILLWKVQGKSFGEIVSLRHAYLSSKKERREIEKNVKSGEITKAEGRRQLDELRVGFSAVAEPLPKKGHPALSLFKKGTKCEEIDFDVIVYDTYDYLDKVISLSLMDPICAALEIYGRKHADARARSLINYMRYGTDNPKEIWLLRYGIDAEDLEWLLPHIEKVDENEILFRASINDESEDRKKIVGRFL